MRFGLCTDVSLINEVAAVGFDYLEGKLNAIATVSEEEFAKLQGLVDQAPIKVERFCLLFPKSMMVIGKGYDEQAMVAYLHTAFSRMKALGSNLVVFGSGKSRMLTEGMSYQQGFKNLVDVTKIVGGIASEYGIKIAIEALNRDETNMVNSLAEGAALSAMVNLENVGLLADSYHMSCESEPWSIIGDVSPLMHTHIAVKDGRRYPLEATDEVVGFIQALKHSGYDATMSIEGKSEDWKQDSVKALATLRSIE